MSLQDNYFSNYVRAIAALFIPIPLGPLFLVRQFRIVGKMSFAEIAVFALISLLCISSLASMLISQHRYFYGLKISCTIFGIFACAYVFSSGLRNFSLLKFINWALMIHLVIIMLEFFFPPVKNITKLVSRMDVFLKLNVDYRVSGFFDGFDIAGILFGIGALTLVFQKSEISIDRLFWPRIALLFFGAMLCSRTGMILVLLAFLAALIRSPKTWIPALAFISLFAVLVTNSDALEATLLFMFDIVVNYLDSGDLSNQSSQDLFDNNWFLPNVTYFGSGAEPWNQGVQSDVGYVQVLDIFGGVGAGIFLAMYISLFFLILQRSKEFFWLIPSVFFVAIKGSYFWSPPLMVILGVVAFYNPRKSGFGS